PILDGLDEIPSGLHVEAIAGIDRAVSGGRPVVITCRSVEYRAAVAKGGKALTATVIELEPVGVQEAIAFLADGGTEAGDRWAPALGSVRAHRAGPLAQALSAPLMVALARAVYTDPAMHPGELCDPCRFPDRAAVEHHLLSAFVPAAYSRHPQPSTVDRRDRPLRRYSPDSAHRWLTYLACHLDQRQTRDLAWWQLHQA